MAEQQPTDGFEQTLAQLEQLVAQLEGGDLPLQESMRLFELGVRLTRHCQSALQDAQQKVQILLQQGESVSIEEFSIEATLADASDRGESL
jgi:exodeoxyribonuclease VII small subunit